MEIQPRRGSFISLSDPSELPYQRREVKGNGYRDYDGLAGSPLFFPFPSSSIFLTAVGNELLFVEIISFFVICEASWWVGIVNYRYIH